jgi:large subunit ribosomal protein L24
MPARVRKDDMVKVISGKDKGKTGRVLRVEPRKSRVFIEGLNIQKRHQRPRSIRDTQRGGEVGGVIEKEGPIHISNVMPLDPKSGDPTRVGVERDDSGHPVRVGRRSGERFE